MMDKSCNSSGDSSAISTSSTSNNTGNKDHHSLRQLNKLSHKISKSSSVPAAVNQETDHHPLPPPPGNLHQHQPSVYNISKNDFRDAVQKLTGSPAHERISSQQVHHAKPQQSSRLQRIRPPPLAHVINRPPSLLNDAHHSWSGGFVQRPTAPLSPLPPLPPVHAAAESPVSSYMRYLQNSMFAMDSNRRELSGSSPLAPPPLNSSRPPPPSQAAPQSFGCLSSPKSPYGLLSPSSLLSPTSGQLGLPVSTTTVALTSPKYKGH